MAEPLENACATIPAMGNHRRRRRGLKPRIHRRAAPGTKPGTLNVAPDAPHTTINVFAYNRDRVLEKHNVAPDEIKPLLGAWPVVCVNVIGLGSEDVLRKVAALFTIHPLAMEDVVNVHQRAKADQYDENVYCVVRMPDATSDEITTQLSLVLGKNYVVTFQERKGDCFEMVRARLRHELSELRSDLRADYLFYRLIDAVVDAYFPILEGVGDRLDTLDDQAASGPAQATFHELHQIRREILMLRRAIWPLRDAIRELQIEPTPYITNDTRLFLRDCHDHAIQLIDLLEAYRDICGDIRDFHMAAVSNRMNEVMKILTVITTIFMPLTFLAGIYGMNFKNSPWNMPELTMRYGYPVLLAVMATLAAFMFWYFKSRGWLEHDASLDTQTDNVSAAERDTTVNDRSND
jgi:magnesium transporter